MSRVYGWHSQLRVGALGVVRNADYLRSHGYIVEDVSADRDYQSQDIDLRARGAKRKRWTTLEVKTDTYDTGNIFLELKSSNGKPGCVWKSRAQWWMYWLPARDELLFIELSVLQMWLYEHGHEYETATVRSGRGAKTWSIEGIKVPICDLLDCGVASSVAWATGGVEEAESSLSLSA